MRIVSVNVGLPCVVEWKHRRVNTAIFKDPIEGSIPVRKLNLDGDRQADLTVHGGADKAVYGYPIEHYEYWRGLIKDLPSTPGAFGENLTTEGVLEGDLNIGDHVRIGTALLQVSQPRMPCYKLQVRFDRDDMTRLFAHSLRCGFYFSVTEEGVITAGDMIEIVERDENRISVAAVNELYYTREVDRDILDRALRVPGLTVESRSMLLSRAAEL